VSIQKSIPSNPYNTPDAYGNFNPPNIAMSDAQISANYMTFATFPISGVYASGSMPPASGALANKVIFVVDQLPESKLQWSDGTSWNQLLPD
jgi:hypothetical protein